MKERRTADAGAINSNDFHAKLFRGTIEGPPEGSRTWESVKHNHRLAVLIAVDAMAEHDLTILTRQVNHSLSHAAYQMGNAFGSIGRGMIAWGRDINSSTRHLIAADLTSAIGRVCLGASPADRGWPTSAFTSGNEQGTRAGVADVPRNLALSRFLWVLLPAVSVVGTLIGQFVIPELLAGDSSGGEYASLSDRNEGLAFVAVLVYGASVAWLLYAVRVRRNRALVRVLLDHGASSAEQGILSVEVRNRSFWRLAAGTFAIMLFFNGLRYLDINAFTLPPLWMEVPVALLTLGTASLTLNGLAIALFLRETYEANDVVRRAVSSAPMPFLDKAPEFYRGLSRHFLTSVGFGIFGVTWVLLHSAGFDFAVTGGKVFIADYKSSLVLSGLNLVASATLLWVFLFSPLWSAHLTMASARSRRLEAAASLVRKAELDGDHTALAESVAHHRFLQEQLPSWPLPLPQLLATVLTGVTLMSAVGGVTVNDLIREVG